MSEQAFFFSNRNGERLFAFEHLVESASDIGVVFCAPFGEEKSRAYRVLAKFARYLSERGIPSLRFDSKGSGDSEGDMVDMTVDSLVEDTCDAISLLKARTKVKRVVLIGLRFGATVAALTAERDERVNSLVLLSPILRGAHYWRELLRMKQFASIWLQQAAKKSSEYKQILERDGRLEIEAQFVSKVFAEQIQQINLLKQTPSFKGDLLVTALAKDSLACELAAKVIEHYAEGNSQVLWTEEERDYWSVLSLFDQYHPIPTFDYTYQWLTGDDRAALSA